jgi:hypothetical protein
MGKRGPKPGDNPTPNAIRVRRWREKRNSPVTYVPVTYADRAVTYTGIEAIRALPRCGARARSNGGLPCRLPVVFGKCRCFLHGGKNRGPKLGSQHALKHGRYTAAAIAGRREAAAAAKAARAAVREAVEAAKGAARRPACSVVPPD